MKKLFFAAVAAIALGGCVSPEPADFVTAGQQCQAAGIAPQFPAHAACTTALVDTNENRAAQIQIVTATTGAIVSGLSLLITLGAIGAASSY